MILISHWIDSNWRLQKRVLNFVHILPPRQDIEISDTILKCLKDWGIKSKIYTISIDITSNNDVAVRIMKDNFSRVKKLMCGGKLFHVCCYTYVLNLMVQDRFSEIVDTTNNIRESADFMGKSNNRALLFVEIVQQLQLLGRKLIHNYRTRWNSTFEMLRCALKFKNIFSRFQDREV